MRDVCDRRAAEARRVQTLVQTSPSYLGCRQRKSRVQSGISLVCDLKHVGVVGHDDLVTTVRIYTHVVADERELDYAELLV